MPGSRVRVPPFPPYISRIRVLAAVWRRSSAKFGAAAEAPGSGGVSRVTDDGTHAGGDVAGFFRLFGPLPLTPTHDASAPLPGLAQGEQLCRSYERFRSLVPDSLITFEHAVLVLLELARAVDLRLDVCADCRVALVLVDEFATGRPSCAHCARRTSAREGAIGTLMQANSGLSEQLPEPATTGLQGGLF